MWRSSRLQSRTITFSDIYINDFRNCLKETETGHFADDTYLLYSSKKLKTIETVMNTELKRVSNWLRLNKLSLNAGKTELIIFHSKRHFPNSAISIKLDGKKLVPVDYIKYLGIYIDKHLAWDYHVHDLCKKLSRANCVLSKLRYNAPKQVCLNVYYAIFYQHMIYGCSVWGITSEENISKVEILQKKCTRIMTFSDFNSHTDPLFIDLKLVKFRDVIKMQHLQLTFQFCNKMVPRDLNIFFNLREDVRKTTLSLKNAKKMCLVIPKTKSVKSGTKSR